MTVQDMPPKTPLIRPKEYFERAENAIHRGLGVFAVYVVAMVVSIYAIVDLLFDQATNVPPEAEEALSRLFPRTIVLVFISAIIGLLVVAFIMHVFNSADATGEFTDAVAVAGWAYAPNALALPFKYFHARAEIRQMSLDGSDPAVFQSQLEAIQNTGLGLISILLLAAVCAWSVYILAYGLAGTHDTTVAKTRFPALIIGVSAFLLGL